MVNLSYILKCRSQRGYNLKQQFLELPVIDGIHVDPMALVTITCHNSKITLSFNVNCFQYRKARGGTVDGGTAPKAGRSRVRFPVGSF